MKFQYQEVLVSWRSSSRCIKSQPLFWVARPYLAPRCHNRLNTHGIRGIKKVTSSLTLHPVAQGPLPRLEANSNVENEDGPTYPTVMQQALNNMRKFSHCVLLTRVGSFYELYFHQAEEYAPLLGLKLARKKTIVGHVAFAGFPFFQLDRYLKMLVQDMDKYVAISEEFANDPSNRIKSGGLLFDRRISRIITPGTLIDEKFMDPWENNFLLSIHPEPEPQLAPGKNVEPSNTAELGLAWLDLSSGDFFTQKIDLTTLPSAIARICPREIVIDKSFDSEKNDLLSSVLVEGHYVVTYHDGNATDPASYWAAQFDDSFTIEMEKFSDLEVSAGNTLLQYVETQLLGNLPRLRPPIRRQSEEYLMIDKSSLKALEIRETLKDGLFEGSLLHSVRRTVTKSGSRLLSRRLMSPSASLDEINIRLDLVTDMLTDPILRQEVITLLRMTFDTWRLLQKFSFGKGIPDDLISLARTIQSTAQIKRLLEQHVEHTRDETSDSLKISVDQLIRRLVLDDAISLSEKIIQAIDEDKLSEQHSLEDHEAVAAVHMAEKVLRDAGEDDKLSGIPQRVRSRLSNESKEKDSENPEEVWIMRTSASKALERLHKDLTKLVEEKDELALALKEKSGVQSLTLKWTPGLGHFCHIKGKATQFDKLEGARRVSISKTTTSFHLPEWTRLGRLIDDAKQRIRVEEQNIFGRLRDKVIKSLVSLRHNAAVLDELDVACSFATLAEEQRLVRPILNYGTTHHIVGGRHPTVEAGLNVEGRKFTSNDCLVGQQHRILLITGPNMAGKSTYLRQNALISILAQTGSYVPAEYASIGIVDKIFSRIGSADNLYQDQSTFMVEMLETAEILKQATNRSFVIMDEVGRGTTPEDGVAVGFAALHHLYHINRSRTLFATHFHALTDLTSSWDCLKCHCTDVVEQDDGSFTYSHRLRSGVNRESHALKVARMAGLPEEAISVAKTVLDQIRRADSDVSVGEVSRRAVSTAF